MKKARAWITRDGVVHLSLEGARSHASNRYGTALCKLARELVAIEKYQAMCDWLEANGSRVVELEELKADQDIQEEGEE